MENKRLKIVFIENSLSNKLSLGLLKFSSYPCKNKEKAKLKIKEFIDKNLNFKLQEKGKSSTRKLYRKFGLDPTKERPSSESLLRRFLKKKDFPEINPFVDTINAFSLVYQIPFGFYDLEKIKNRITVREGKEGESYISLKNRTFHLKGKIVLEDEISPFGNPTSDSQRTAVSKKTSEFLSVAFFNLDFQQKEDILYKLETVLKDIFFIKELYWKVVDEKSTFF